MDQIFENRLAFIKYLFQQGLEESNRSEPYSSICILSFHNSIELFLQLSAEYLQVDVSNVPFMEYWEKISIKMESAELPLRESIRKLNKARVALKHHGNFPSKLDIDAFKIYTNDFFSQATPLIFKINFEDVSMINYIYPEIAKEKVRLAYQLMNEGNLEGSIDKLATAFKDILNDYEKRMSDKFGRSPFRLSRNLSFIRAKDLNLQFDNPRMTSKLPQFVDEIKDSIESMQETIKILTLGIDYKKYNRFNNLMPLVQQTINGTYHIVRNNWHPRQVGAKVDINYCINFLTELCLTLNEFTPHSESIEIKT